MYDGTIGRKMTVAGAGIALMAAVAAGFDGNPASQDLPPAWIDGKLPILQFQKDAVRNRAWALTPAGVFVVDLKTRRTVAHVPLPGWNWAGEPYGCTPSLALGPQGAALVSSDVVPTLWRIDPRTLAVSRHELVLDADSGRDVGFSGLSYSARQATYIAVACGQGSIWRVDSSLKRGQKVS